MSPHRSTSAEGNLRALPTDLILEIISRLPSKSVARCRCVSKLWASLLTPDSPYFTELFLTQSKTRPHLIFTVKKNYYEGCLYSCLQPQISYENSTSSLSVTAEFHTSFFKSWSLQVSPPVSGLIYFSNMPNCPMICSPSTGYIFQLPHRTNIVPSFFGYDPINKQFIVLTTTHHGLKPSYQILKLGSGRPSWRTIECPLHHYLPQTYICINGILYYIASFESNRKIASFDLNSEEFKLIVEHPHSWVGYSEVLVNFKGKLGRINMIKRSHDVELSLWVLEDVEKQEWSKHASYLPSKLWNTKLSDISIVGAE